VREHRMFETSVQLSANDVQHLFAHVRLALARRRRVPTTSP
jgi:hypothetical protein